MAKVSHMVLPVSDVHKSRDWYVGKLGFTRESSKTTVLGLRCGGSGPRRIHESPMGRSHDAEGNAQSGGNNRLRWA